MSVNTVLLDFSIDPNQIADDLARKDVLKKIRENLENYFPHLAFTYDMLTDDGYLCMLKEKDGVIVTIRFFHTPGLITINIEYFRAENEATKFSFDSTRELENTLVRNLNLKHGQTLVPIQRGPVTKYFPTSDDRLLEYDIDAVLYDERSDFQKIQIVHSKTLGNMLVLDELQNIAEADLIYTETLMQRGKENYEGKDIAILGGGDGALLYELLKENPKSVAMLEIDESVMVGCNKYMRSICGDVLEHRSGDNYEIIVGDCMVTLNKYIKEGKTFDYVFGDLTDIPISKTPTGEIWDFIRSILEASFKVLKKNGKYMTHGNGVNCPESLKMYEEQLKALSPAVKYTKDKAFVPSFMEEWIFYQVSVDNV